MNIEITIRAESPEEMRRAFAQLAGAAVQITSDCAEIGTAEAVIAPAVTTEPEPAPEPEPEKPKKAPRKKRAEAPQEPQEAPEPPAPEQTPAEPQNAQESAQEAPVSVQESPQEQAPAEPAKPVPTIDQIANAGAALLDGDIEGMMPKLLALLQEFGVQAITQLKPEQLGEFAERLRALGAEV